MVSLAWLGILPQVHHHDDQEQEDCLMSTNHSCIFHNNKSFDVAVAKLHDFYDAIST